MLIALLFATSIAVLAGCGASTGDAAGQPPDSSGGQSGDPGSGGPSDCSGERWGGRGMPWISARCTPIGEAQFSCECVEQDPAMVDPTFNGRTGTQAGSPSFVAACRAALRDQCAIDPDAPVFCGLAEVGTCWPDADRDWSCECGQGVQYRAQTDSACDRALWANCGDRCETAFGTCGETGEASYRCECTGVDGPLPPEPEPPQMNDDGTIQGAGVTLDSPRTCSAAMALYCGERCESNSGRCEPAADGFECRCIAGGGRLQRFAELGGISPAACGMALQRACGEEVLAPMTTCTEPRAKCEALPRNWPPGAARTDSFEYRCQCDGGPPISLEASACYRAMLAACPDAVGDVSAAPAAAAQLGALCEHASDCAFNVCHRGRLQREGVCSAPCMTDDDCPSHALCSFSEGADIGHCFVACDSNAGGYFACEQRNAAFYDPLNCLDRVDLDYAALANTAGEGGQICAPLSDGYWPLPVRR